MSFWEIMNIVAWVMSGAIAFWLVYDFIKVEKHFNKSDKKQN